MAQNGSLDTTTAFAKSLGTNDSAQKSDSTSNTTMAKVTEDAAVNFQGLISFTLRFLSDATNETLAACFIGLGASTYIVFGRLGLVLIGVVGGVILHATWEEQSKTQIDKELNVSDSKNRRERGLDVVRRILDGPGNSGAADTESELALNQEETSLSSSEPDFSSFEPGTAAALTSLTDAVIRDYVKYSGPALIISIGILTLPGGGTPLCCLQTIHFRQVVGEYLPVFFLQFRHILHEKDQQMYFSTFSQIPLRLLSFFLMNFLRRHLRIPDPTIMTFQKLCTGIWKPALSQIWPMF